MPVRITPLCLGVCQGAQVCAMEVGVFASLFFGHFGAKAWALRKEILLSGDTAAGKARLGEFEAFLRAQFAREYLGEELGSQNGSAAPAQVAMSSMSAEGGGAGQTERNIWVESGPGAPAPVFLDAAPGQATMSGPEPPNKAAPAMIGRPQGSGILEPSNPRSTDWAEEMDRAWRKLSLAGQVRAALESAARIEQQNMANTQLADAMYMPKSSSEVATDSARQKRAKTEQALLQRAGLMQKKPAGEQQGEGAVAASAEEVLNDFLYKLLRADGDPAGTWAVPRKNVGMLVQALRAYLRTMEKQPLAGVGEQDQANAPPSFARGHTTPLLLRRRRESVVGEDSQMLNPETTLKRQTAVGPTCDPCYAAAQGRCAPAVSRPFACCKTGCCDLCAPATSIDHVQDHGHYHPPQDGVMRSRVQESLMQRTPGSS
eukprot:g12359.t1